MLGTLGVHTPSPWTMERPNQLSSSDGSGIWMLADVPGEVFEAIDTDNFYIWVKCSGVGASSNDSLNKSLKTFLSQKFLCKLTLYLYHILPLKKLIIYCQNHFGSFKKLLCKLPLYLYHILPLKKLIIYCQNHFGSFKLPLYLYHILPLKKLIIYCQNHFGSFKKLLCKLPLYLYHTLQR